MDPSLLKDPQLGSGSAEAGLFWILVDREEDHQRGKLNSSAAQTSSLSSLFCVCGDQTPFNSPLHVLQLSKHLTCTASAI